MSRKDPYFSFKDKDSAEYKPQYGTAYTPRQEKILSGELPLEDIRPNELSLLKQRENPRGEVRAYEIPPRLSEEMLHPLDAYYNPNPAEEAAEILRKLTPPGFES